MPRFPAYPNEGRTVREYPLDEYADFIEGAFVVVDGGEVEECGENPALIAGVALFDAGNLPLEDMMSVAVAKSKATFILQGNVAPVQADEGESYGITKDSDGVWHVDKTKTGANARVRVERVFIGNNRDQYEVSVLPGNRQFD
jgi:hypothetical protein